MEDFPEIEVSDLSFVHVCNTKIGNGIDKDHLNRSNLLTVSNKYGLVFAASDKKLKVMTTSGLDDQMTRIRSIRTSKKMVENDAVTYDLEGEIVHLSLNSSDEYLAVCTSKNGFIFAEIYDIGVMAKDYNQPFSPFQEIKLTSSSNEILVDFSWNPNPDFSKTFVSCSSSGDLSVFEVHPSEVKLVGNLGPSSQGGANTCACWSPKGKQVAVGNGSGKVTLYLPTMTPKNVIQVCPKVKEAYGDVAVMDILWETNQTFFIVYKSKSNDSEQPLLVYLRPDANNQPTYGFYGDICFGSAGSKYMRYQFNLIRQWNLLLISSATSSEMCLLAKEKDTWYKCDLEHKPEVCSLGNDFEIYCPRGVCFVYCSKFKWTVKVADEEKTVVSLPVMTMSSDGCISFLQFVTQNPDHQSINVVPQLLSSEGAIIRTPQQPKVLPAHPPQPSAHSPVTPDPTSVKPNFSTFSFPGAQQQANLSFSGLQQAASVTNDNNNSQVSSNPIGQTFNQSMQKTFTNKVTLDLSGGHKAPPSAEPVAESRKTLQLGNFAQPAKVNEPLTYKGHLEESTVTSTLPADGSDDPYAQSIADEIKHFSKEVKDVLQKLSAFKIDKNFSAELEELNSGMKTLLAQKSELCQELLNLKKESEEQKTETLELFATMERFRVTHERNNDKNYLALLRQRPLDPTRKSKMAALESALGYVGMEISKVDSILDSNLQECLDAQKRQRFIQPPNLHIIYETLHSNRISICKIKNALSSIKKRVDNDPNLSKNNVLNLSQLFTKSCTLTSPTKRQKVNEREKEAQLREYLLNRKVVTVRSTAPENLNCSRIVSAVQMREIEGRKNNNQQQQQQSQSPMIPITQQYQPQSPKSPVKQQQHQREVVLQPKQLDIQKSLPPAFGHPTKPRMVQNLPTVDVVSAQQAPKTLKMFSPSKDPVKAVPFQSDGVAKCSEQTSILPSISNMTMPSFDSGKSFFSPQPSLQLQPTLATTTTFGAGINLSGMSKMPTSPNKNLTFSLSSVTTSTPLTKTFEVPGLSCSKPTSLSTPFQSLAEGVSGASTKPSQPGLAFASQNLFRSKASSSDSSASEASPQTHGKQLEDNQKPEELKEQKSPKILILQNPLKMMKQMGDEIGKSSFNVGNVDSNQALKPTMTPMVETSSDPRDSVIKTEEESDYSKSTSVVGPPESDENNSVGDASVQPEEGKAFDLSKKSVILPSSSSSPFAINTGSLGLFGLKKVEPPSEKVTSISEVAEASKSSGIHEVSGDKMSMVEASATGTTMFGNTATSSTAFGGSGIFAKPLAPTSSPNIATTQSPLFADMTSGQRLIGTSSAAPSSAFGSVDGAITSATSVFGDNGSMSLLGKALTSNATTSMAFEAPATTSTVFGTLATSSAMTFESDTSISTTVPVGDTNTTASSLVFGTNKASSPSPFGSTAAISAPIFGSAAIASTPAFGSTTTSTPSVFGSKTTSTPSIFGSTTTTIASAGIFGSSTVTTASATSIFGSATTTIASAGIFGSSTVTTASATSIFGSATTTASVFGASAGTLFGTPSTTVSSVFQAADNFSRSTFASAKPTVVPTVFGSPAPSLFGTTAVSSATPTVFGVFGAPSSPAQSVFGANTPVSPFAVSSSGPATGNASSTMFGASAFGKASSAGQVFGSASNSIFSQTNTSTPAFGGNSFGQTSAPVFGQGSAFGQASAPSANESSGSIFGSSVSFGGLGGKPSKEKAAMNVFGNTSVFGSTTQASSIFGQSQTSSGFGSVKTDATIQGSFTGSNSNVASAGFGGFQKQAAPAFGNTGAFGGTPVFGSLGSNNPTAFGGAPTFGGFGSSTAASPGNTQGRLFGTGSGDNGGFASLANASTPSFEGLIQRSGGAEFGSVAQQGGFGSFGGGEQTSSGFGTTFQAKSPQFTQFRS